MDEPEIHDYSAAFDYLTLLMDRTIASATVDRLRDTGPAIRKAKDIVRASGLPVLPKHNKHVDKDIRRIEERTPLSPVLLVRSPSGLIIADGYHRVCAAYHFDEDALIACVLVSMP